MHVDFSSPSGLSRIWKWRWCISRDGWTVAKYSVNNGIPLMMLAPFGLNQLTVLRSPFCPPKRQPLSKSYRIRYSSEIQVLVATKSHIVYDISLWVTKPQYRVTRGHYSGTMCGT